MILLQITKGYQGVELVEGVGGGDGVVSVTNKAIFFILIFITMMVIIETKICFRLKSRNQPKVLVFKILRLESCI